MFDLQDLRESIWELQPHELAELEYLIHQRRIELIPETHRQAVQVWAVKLNEAIQHFWESFSADDAAEIAERVMQGELDPDEMRLLNWMEDWGEDDETP